METMILICLILIIVLQLQDKIIFKGKKESSTQLKKPVGELPDIMGKTKTQADILLPQSADKSHQREQEHMQATFEEPDADKPDFEEEERDWAPSEAEEGDVLSDGVHYEEVSTAVDLLTRETLDDASADKAIKIVKKIQGTEFFSLLESKMSGVSQRIAELLEKNLAPLNESAVKDEDDFDIQEFV